MPPVPLWADVGIPVQDNWVDEVKLEEYHQILIDGAQAVKIVPDDQGLKFAAAVGETCGVTIQNAWIRTNLQIQSPRNLAN